MSTEHDEYTDEDMANVGRALMKAIAAHADEGWHSMNCPAEIVGDLRNERDELKEECELLRLDAKRYRFLRNEDNWGDDSGDDCWARLGESHAGEFDAVVDKRMEAHQVANATVRRPPVNKLNEALSFN